MENKGHGHNWIKLKANASRRQTYFDVFSSRLLVISITCSWSSANVLLLSLPSSIYIGATYAVLRRLEPAFIYPSWQVSTRPTEWIGMDRDARIAGCSCQRQTNISIIWGLRIEPCKEMLCHSLRFWSKEISWPRMKQWNANNLVSSSSGLTALLPTALAWLISTAAPFADSLNDVRIDCVYVNVAARKDVLRPNGSGASRWKAYKNDWVA